MSEDKILNINGIDYVITKHPNGALSKKKLIVEDSEPIIEEVEKEIDILAEILLTQMEILANQNAQDEVLAEMLLNSLEV